MCIEPWVNWRQPNQNAIGSTTMYPQCLCNINLILNETLSAGDRVYRYKTKCHDFPLYWSHLRENFNCKLFLVLLQTSVGICLELSCIMSITKTFWLFVTCNLLLKNNYSFEWGFVCYIVDTSSKCFNHINWGHMYLIPFRHWRGTLMINKF